ncbi:hypothetical protein AB0K43_30025 [Kitasatospora sp. NPDC049258]|uniref:hypothetical protein n=1 Tax=Kitasatospora sp. NPDC049258 TaxID=3155394 RepID=UPI003424D2CD
MNGLRRRWAQLGLLGPARLRLALVIAALAATAFTLLTSLPAYADPTPTPSPATSPAAGPVAPSPQEQDQIQEILREQSEKLTEAQQQALLDRRTEELRKLLPDEGGVLGVFNVTDRGGMPISAYTVGSDTGGALDWDLGVENLLAELCFMGTKWLIAFCCWLISWALSFGLAKLLLKPVLSVADSLHARVIVQMGLPSLFLAVCALMCVARIFFGDKARGWGDAALSILLAALTTTLLASTPTTLMGEDHGAIAVTRGLALEVAAIVLETDPTGAATGAPAAEATSGSLARPLTDALTDAFIVQPAMLLQYGRTFDGDCARMYSESKLQQLAFDRAMNAQTNKLKKVTHLADYLPGGEMVSSWYDWQIDLSSRWAVDHFGDPPMEAFEKKCVPGDAGAAKKASLDKVGGALFLLVAAVIVTVLISALAGSFLVAQCRIAWDAVRGEAALVVGTVPGAGRTFLWDWCASVLRSLGQMLASVIALAIFIVVIQAVLDPVQTDWGRELTLRFLAVDLVCIAAVKKRKTLADRSRQVSANFRAKMAAGRVGGTHGSIVSTPVSAAAGKRPQITRGLVRTAAASVALARGNPLAAIGYAMPQSVGATALLSRIASGQGGAHRPGGHGAGRPARPAGRPAPTSNRRRPGPAAPPHPAHPTRPVFPPRPAHPPRPTAPPSRVRQVPVQPAASAQQQRLRQRLDRPVRRTPPRRRR